MTQRPELNMNTVSDAKVDVLEDQGQAAYTAVACWRLQCRDGMLQGKLKGCSTVIFWKCIESICFKVHNS